MKEAVCLSINDYPGLGSDLGMCNNDSKDLKVFFETLGFTVTRYIDSQVTKNLFISELTRLVNKAVAGDVIVLSYSGHGTQVYDRSGDEVDYYDEAVYLYDGPLIDDVLCNILIHLQDGVTCVIILDSCFSGTATKVKNGEKVRFLKTTKRRKKGIRRGKFLRSDSIKNLLFSGCSDSEYSYDAGELGNGAFTYYFLKQYSDGVTYEGHKNAVRTKLPSPSYPQTPDLEGPIELFSQIAYVEPGIPTSIPPLPASDYTSLWVKILEYVIKILAAIFGGKKKRGT